MKKTQALAASHSRSTMANTNAFPLKKILTHGINQNWQKNYVQNFVSSWLSVMRTFSLFKNYKKDYIISMSSQEVIPNERKFS